jgi:hypothetical protein
MPDIELVIARHREDLRWLKRVPRSMRATVYNKGEDGQQGEPLPNIGREAHTYLHHIVRHYDDLADVTVFCQGKPFDHVPDLHKTLRQLDAIQDSGGTASGRPIRTRRACPSSKASEGLETRLRELGFLWLGFVIDRDDRTGSLLFQNWTKNTDRHPLPLDDFWKALWGEAAIEACVFYPGGNFIVTQDQVRARPRAFYEKALRLSGDLADAAHCFERVWDRVFGVNGIPEQHRNGPYPVFFKPIRRLNSL